MILAKKKKYIGDIEIVDCFFRQCFIIIVTLPNFTPIFHI